MINLSTLAAARSVHTDGMRFICLTDVVQLLGGDPNDGGLAETYRKLPSEHARIAELSDGEKKEQLPVVSMQGLAMFLRITTQAPLVAVSLDVLQEWGENQATLASSSKGFATRWNEQPFRELIRTHGHSMSEMTKLLNLHRLASEKPITQASLTACATGRQVPNPTLLRCLRRVFPSFGDGELFTADVLTAFEAKYGDTPAVVERAYTLTPGYAMQQRALLTASTPAPSGPSAPSEPTPFASPDPLAGPDDDIGSEAWMARQEALADAAAAEAIGMPGMSYEAGFAAVMGAKKPQVSPFGEE